MSGVDKEENPQVSTGDVSAPTKSIMTITSKDVTVRFGQIVALNNLSIDIPPGIVGLLGPNGAGKSTFIKAVLGLLQPETGSISIAGHDSRTENDIIRDMIGYMPEHDCLIDTFNAVDFVTYMGQLSGMKKKDAIPRSHEVLDFVGIGEEKYRLISSYSTGMKQRVKLAQAIVHDPKILFLDEPTNGMDPIGREDMLALIQKIKASDKTILVSSHILHDVEKVSNHAIIISNGRLVTEGDLEELLSGQDDIKRVKVRGEHSARDNFIEALGNSYSVKKVVSEGGQTSISFVNNEGSAPVFKLGQEKNIQIRAYYPERLTLEDLFIETLEQKEGGGHIDGN